MGHLKIDIHRAEDQQYVGQTIDMLLGRTKAVASVVRTANTDTFKSVLVESDSLTDDELRRAWEAIESVNPRRGEVLIPDDSPIRRLPDNSSREQALIFDGIRYAAEMMDIAYWRLFDLLQEMSSLPDDKLTTRQIATAMLDVWSVVDSVNRLRDLLREPIGVRHDAWWKLFILRTKDIDALRNDIQHQTGKARLGVLVANAAQIWGFLSWAEIRNGRYTGNWYLMSPGAVYKNDQWIHAGPSVPSEPLPFGRVRLQAYGRDVYLGKIVRAVQNMINELTNAIQDGLVRAVGTPATGRNGGDIIYASRIEVEMNDGSKVIVRPDVGI